ncbi:MAG TPA: ROK family protein [Solirubrobacteraceae bacterium]
MSGAAEYAGIDVGGTKIAAAALVDNHLVGDWRVEPTDTSDAAALVDQIVDAVEAVRTPGCQAVGIGVPSVVEFATGRIRASVNIPLADLPLRALLSDRIGLPVYVENDASCAALAEAFDQGRMVSPDLVMFAVGTGVGGGLVLNGKLYRGATGAAAEVGHTLIGLDLSHGAPLPGHKAPWDGSLEALGAGRALDHLGEAAARAAPDSELGRVLAREGEVRGIDVVTAAHAGDAAAADLVRILGERLGIGVANAINMFDPGEIVVGGGVMAAGDLLMEPLRRVAAAYTLPGVGTETRIRLARHGPKAGLMGAALNAQQEHQLDLRRAGRA